MSPDPRKTPPRGGSSAKPSAKWPSRLSGAQRTGLIASALVLAGLFVGFAIAQGIGQPSVPSDSIAVVKDAPAGLSPITKEQFAHAFKQQASSLPKPPKPSSPQYDDVKKAAIDNLLDTVWIQGEASDLGIEPTDREVQTQLKTIKGGFGSEAAYQKFIKQSGYTPEDVRTVAKLRVLGSAIEAAITKGVPPVTKSDIQDFYNGAQEQFQLPATRDVRLVLNRDRAKVEQAKTALEADSSTASWNKIAKQYSTDPASKDNGGLRPGLTEGLVEEPLNSKIFAATQGTISGLVKTPLGWYVFEVEKENPATTQPLKDVQSQIRSQLQSQAQTQARNDFVEDYLSKWKSRTFCASDFLVERCDNFKPSGHPQNAPAACYEADPKKGIPAACPAPVLQLVPALPGTISLLAPQGERLPQRPRPLGLPPPTSGGLPGAIPGGLPPGVGAPTP